MTQETKFTPAPWDKMIHDDGFTRVGASTLIAKVYSQEFKNTENEHANAHLIATAPEMYEALKNLCDAIQEGDIQTISDRAINGIDTLKKARGKV